MYLYLDIKSSKQLKANIINFLNSLFLQLNIISWSPYDLFSRTIISWGFLGGTSGKEPACQCRRQERCRLDPWVGKIPRRRAQQPIPVFLPKESRGQRSLVGYSPQDHKESDTKIRSHYKLLIIEPLAYFNPKLLIYTIPFSPLVVISCFQSVNLCL